jgi:nucleotide-binding universal stress UspA family protein
VIHSNSIHGGRLPAIGKPPAIQLDSVVFATDFSPASQNAGLYASAVSVRFNTSLVVAHAFTLTQAALEVEAEKPFRCQQRANLEYDLALTAEELKSGLGTTELALMEGDPRNVIPSFVRSRSSALIVLGTHGRGSIDRFILGSTAEEILRHSTGPALTIGPNVDILHAGALNIRRILYATDCSPEAAHSAPVAVALADAFSAELDVLHVVNANDMDQPEQLHRLKQHFCGAVDAILPDGAGQICESHTFVRIGRPHTDILKHLEEREIDLLVLGLHRNTHLGMQNRTSGAFPIIVKAQCPVLTVALGSALVTMED